MTYHWHSNGRNCGDNTSSTGFHSHWGGIHGHNKIAGTTTLGERGQAVIPREAREALGLESGDKLVVFCNEARGSVTLVKADVFEDFADIIMAKSKKLEKIANAVWEAVYDEEHVENEAGAESEADAEPGNEADAEASEAPRNDGTAGADNPASSPADDETRR